MNVQNRILVSLPLYLGDHVGQYNVFELLHYNGYDMNLGILSYARFREVNLTGCKPGWKLQNNGAVLEDCRLPDVPVVFIEGRAMYLWEAKSEVRQFLAVRYRAVLEESPAAARGEVLSI